jgi:excisionase family DNA binding protein
VAIQSVGDVLDLQPSGAVIGPLACAVFSQMLERPLRRRISASTGIDPRNAAELRAAFEELDRVGREWINQTQRLISVVPRLPRFSTEMASDSSAEMINTKIAGEMLRLSDSRIRQLLRSGELPGRKVGRRWLVRRTAVLAYRAPRKAAA